MSLELEKQNEFANNKILCHFEFIHSFHFDLYGLKGFSFHFFLCIRGHTLGNDDFFLENHFINYANAISILETATATKAAWLMVKWTVVEKGHQVSR